LSRRQKGGKNQSFKLDLIISQLQIFALHLLVLFLTKFSHQGEAYFRSLSATGFTFLYSGTSLYSKTLSMVYSHLKNSFESKWPSNSGISTLKSKEWLDSLWFLVGLGQSSWPKKAKGLLSSS